MNLTESLKKPKLFVLFSGGIDSTSLLHYYKSMDDTPIAIHFQYNQPNGHSELNAVKSITDYYDLELKIFDIGFPIIMKKYEFIGRNALFCLSAASIVGESSRISLGIHSNTEYYDCTPDFVSSMQELLDGYFAGSVQIETPFINYTKNDIIDYATANNVPLDLTYSCLSSNAPPCGRCPSCLDRIDYYGHK